MSLEDSLNQLTSTLADQNASNQALVGELRKLIGEAQADQSLLVAAVSRYGDASEKTLEALRTLAEQSEKLEDAAQTFNQAATQSHKNASELAQLIQLMQVQTQQQNLSLEQQNLSLKYQNESIQATLRIAKESARSTWIQNSLFFFLGVLIPVVVQLMVRLI